MELEEELVFTHKVGKVHVGIMRVIFGYRVRAGVEHEREGIPLEYSVDWCCGQNLDYINMSLNYILGFLQNGGSIHDLPGSSKRKPIYNDREFLDWMVSTYVPPKTIVQANQFTLLEADLQVGKNFENIEDVNKLG